MGDHIILYIAGSALTRILGTIRGLGLKLFVNQLESLELIIALIPRETFICYVCPGQPSFTIEDIINKAIS